MTWLTKLRTGGSMDRASDSGSEGWGFESLPVYHQKAAFCLPTKGCFLHDVFPYGNVMCASRVMFASQVMCPAGVRGNTSHHFG